MNVRAIGQSTSLTPDQLSIAGIAIGDGLVALVTVSLTRTRTFTAASSGPPIQLLAANDQRQGATIKNEATTNLHVDEAIVASVATTGERIVPPGDFFEVDENYLGAVFGWFDAGVTGNYVTIELS